MAAMKPENIVLDERITPRANDDSLKIKALDQSLDAGAEFPPLLVDRASKRLVDGRRRLRVYKMRKWTVVPVTFRDFPGGLKEMLSAAIAANAAHGQPMEPQDHIAAVRRMEALGGSVRDVAAALQIPVTALEALRETRTAYTEKGEALTLKPALRNLAGQTLSPARVEANRSMPANDYRFLMNRVTQGLDAGLIPHDDVHDPIVEKLAEAIERHMTVAARG